MRIAIFAAMVLALSCVGVVRADDAEKPEGGAAAQAEERGPRGEGRGARGRRGGANREEMLKKFDKDGDGKLSEEERAELRKSFEGARGEGAEGRGPRGRFGGGEGRRGGAGREEMLKKFDKDGDGKLSEEERAELRKSFEGTRGEGRRGGEGRPEGGRRGRRPAPPAE